MGTDTAALRAKLLRLMRGQEAAQAFRNGSRFAGSCPAKRRWRQEGVCPTLIHAQDGGRSGQIPEYGRMTGSRGRWRSCAALDPASAARNAHPTVIEDLDI
jgi:hypothetical protein